MIGLETNCVSCSFPGSVKRSPGRLVTVLTRSLGARRLALVEDVVGAALVQALETWSRRGVPYLDIHEDDPLDEAQFARWVKQASQLPGERM